MHHTLISISDFISDTVSLKYRIFRAYEALKVTISLTDYKIIYQKQNTEHVQEIQGKK